MTRLRSREAALRDNLAAQGLNSAAVSDIVTHNWAASTSQGHDSAWRMWEQHCAECLDATRRDDPSPADLVNFLTRIRERGMERKNSYGADSGRGAEYDGRRARRERGQRCRPQGAGYIA